MTHDLLSAVEDSLMNLDRLASALLLLTLALETLDEQPEDFIQRVRVLVQSAGGEIDGARDDLPYRLKLVKKELTKTHLPGCPCGQVED